ncbi:MAG TPA: 2-oxoacid ferredoxin oxidoreductase [Desulfobacteraceae bacterium]|nr:2-oxoacid ferredoxin oxidoreductase [Desulfobacteraceae bacterium]|tara:strand:+ start:1322 stop:2176 length:855 start_codon:yes stop_codon:yes gene_type:complete
MTTSIFDTDRENQWCPGCGNFAILAAMKQAFEDQNLKPRDILLVGGIGQAGKTPHYLACNMLHGLHGRALPMATGAKLANHHLNVVVSSGDGDCYGEGGNHFLAAIRRNLDITLLVHNNQVYGLTKGQSSPTTDLAMGTKLTPGGPTSTPLNPLALALTAGAGFVARGFSGAGEQLAGLIQEAMNFRGFAMIDIFQPCVSFNKINTHLWYKERVKDLGDTGHDPTDLPQALAVAMTEPGTQIPTGVLYRKPGVPFQDRFTVLKDKALTDYPFAGDQINDILSGI